MALPQILTPRKIRDLARRQLRRTNASDAALITLCGFCYFNKLELSLLNAEDLIKEHGKIQPELIIPKRITGKDENRKCEIGKDGFVVEMLHKLIDWRKKQDFDCIHNSGLYAGLQPDKRLFRTPKGEPFKTRLNNRNCLEPYSLNNYLNRINYGEGIDVRGLQESFIVNFWNLCKKAGDAETDIVRTLRRITGLQVTTIKPKCIRNDAAIRDVMAGMYHNIEVAS